MEAPFAPSLLMEIRKRMGKSVFDIFQASIIDSVEEAKAKQKNSDGVAVVVHLRWDTFNEGSI